MDSAIFFSFSFISKANGNFESNELWRRPIRKLSKSSVADKIRFESRGKLQFYPIAWNMNGPSSRKECGEWMAKKPRRGTNLWWACHKMNNIFRNTFHRFRTHVMRNNHFLFATRLMYIWCVCMCGGSTFFVGLVGVYISYGLKWVWIACLMWNSIVHRFRWLLKFHHSIADVMVTASATKNERHWNPITITAIVAVHSIHRSQYSIALGTVEREHKWCASHNAISMWPLDRD